MPDVLTPLERAVIALSRHDPVWSLVPQGPVARWIGGRAGPLPLANPRLEAVRRYAILRRLHGTALDPREYERLHELGYDPSNIDEIDACVARFRVTTVPTPLQPIEMGIPVRHPSKMRGQRAALLAILPFTFCCGPAHAQTQTVTQSPVVGPDEEQGNGDHFTIGIGAAYMPAYQGSDKYRFQPLPAINVKWGRFFANFQDGIGATLIDNDLVTIGAGLTLADNYRAKDAPPGIGRLSVGLGARGFVKLRQAGFEAVLGGTKIVTGSTEGFVADASLSYPIFASRRMMLIPSIGTTWGDRKHNDRYFGVNVQQSAASGLRQFHTGSGFINAKIELAAQYRLTDRFSLGVVGGVSTLAGDMKDSPIVREKTRPFGIAFISYSF